MSDKNALLISVALANGHVGKLRAAFQKSSHR